MVRSWSHEDADVSRCNREEGWSETSRSPGNPKARNSLEIGAAQAAGLNYILRIVPVSYFLLNPAQAWFAGEILSGSKSCQGQLSSTDAQMPVAGPQASTGTSTDTGPSSITH